MHRQLPQVPVHAITALGTGLDHQVYAVNDDLVARFDRCHDSGRAGRLRREHQLLRFLAGWSPIPVPRPVWCVPEDGLLGLAKVPGTPMIQLTAAERSALAVGVAAQLGALLAALHALPPEHPLVADAPVDDMTALDRLAEAAHLFGQVRPHLQPAVRHAVQGFLSTPPPTAASKPVLSHNDLGIEHVLIDPQSGGVSGVIDWTDAAVVDPARDFGLVLRDLGPRALASAVTGYGSDAADPTPLLDRA